MSNPTRDQILNTLREIPGVEVRNINGPIASFRRNVEVFVSRWRDDICITVNKVDRQATLAEAVAALTPAPSPVPEIDPEHPELHCHRCQSPNVNWFAPSPLWNAVMRDGSINGTEEFGGIVCPTCFAILAENRGIAERWKLTAKTVHVELETVTPSGRVWDEKTDMWVEPEEKPITPDDGLPMYDWVAGLKGAKEGRPTWTDVCILNFVAPGSITRTVVKFMFAGERLSSAYIGFEQLATPTTKAEVLATLRMCNVEVEG